MMTKIRQGAGLDGRLKAHPHGPLLALHHAAHGVPSGNAVWQGHADAGDSPPASSPAGGLPGTGLHGPARTASWQPVDSLLAAC